MEYVGAIVSVSRIILEYFDLIEGVSTKVTKLVHQSFISAKENLEYAKTAYGENQINYVIEAKNNFIKAIAVEENENKVLALAGLALCQKILGDNAGAQRSINRINNVKLTKQEIMKNGAKQAVKSGLKSIFNPFAFLDFFSRSSTDSKIEERITILENEKTKAKKKLSELLQKTYQIDKK